MLENDHIGRLEAAEFLESLERMERCDHAGGRDVVDGMVFCAGCRCLLPGE